MFEYCPNCGKLWDTEESDFQSCDSCGYPTNEDDTDYNFEHPDINDYNGFIDLGNKYT
jgi:uncharacterized membrane protein YvbJ